MPISPEAITANSRASPTSARVLDGGAQVEQLARQRERLEPYGLVPERLDHAAVSIAHGALGRLPRVQVAHLDHAGLMQLLEAAEARPQRRVAGGAVGGVAQPRRLQQR